MRATRPWHDQRVTALTRRPATAADVAARAGVSRATVSHILNGRQENFLPETRDRVLQAAEELDYRPSPAGRNLVRGRGDTIVLLVPRSTIGQNQQRAMERLTGYATAIGANAVLRFADSDPDSTATAVLRLRPLAVVDLGALTAATHDRLERQGVPTVPRPRGDADDTADIEDGIAELQVAESTRRGQRQVVYASLLDEQPDPWSPRRLAALTRATAQRGLEPPVAVAVPPESDAATQTLAPLLASTPLAVCAYNDVVALAVLAAARRLGRAVPDELSIVGVDHTPYGQLVEPRLSTISIDMNQVLDHAVAELGDLRGAGASAVNAAAGPILTLVRGGTS